MRTCVGSAADAGAGLAAAQYVDWPAPVKPDSVGTCGGSAVAAETGLEASAGVSDQVFCAPLHRSKRLYGSMLSLYLCRHPVEGCRLPVSDLHWPRQRRQPRRQRPHQPCEVSHVVGLCQVPLVWPKLASLV